MKFKVGDKVRVKSLEWYNENEDGGLINFKKGPFFTKGMSIYCGKEAIIKRIDGNSYILDLDTSYFFAEDSVEPISDEFGLQVDNISVSTNTCITLEDGQTAKICNENGKTKIAIENNVEEPKFKKGDVMFLETQGYNKIYQHIAIVKNADKDGIHIHVSLCVNNNELTLSKIDAWFSNVNIKSIRFATEEEKRTLFLAMLKEGLFWDEKKMKVRTLKDGDIVTIKDDNGEDWQSIFKEIKEGIFYSYSDLDCDKKLYRGPFGEINQILSIRYATTKERQTLFDKIEEKEHKKWNKETKEFETLKWKPKIGETYWYITEELYVDSFMEENDKIDKEFGKVNNKFKTKELAEVAADKIKELLSKL